MVYDICLYSYKAMQPGAARGKTGSNPLSTQANTGAGIDLTAAATAVGPSIHYILYTRVRVFLLLAFGALLVFLYASC